jgi:hypothetical protein
MFHMAPKYLNAASVYIDVKVHKVISSSGSLRRLQLFNWPIHSSPLLNLKAHYRVQKITPLDPTLSQMNQVHTLPSYSIRPVLILSSHPLLRLPNGIIFQDLSIKNTHIASTYACYTSRPSHPHWCCNCSNIWWNADKNWYLVLRLEYWWTQKPKVVIKRTTVYIAKETAKIITILLNISIVWGIFDTHDVWLSYNDRSLSLLNIKFLVIFLNLSRRMLG